MLEELHPTGFKFKVALPLEQFHINIRETSLHFEFPELIQEITAFQGVVLLILPGVCLHKHTDTNTHTVTDLG